LKDDGATDAEYGGNKVRKLERISLAALQRGAQRLVTFGAAGSHHVLTTAIFARRLQLGSAAVLIPQPRTRHAADVLCASVGQGVVVHPASSSLAVPFALSRMLRASDYVIPPGGSNLLGTLAYADAISELVAQVHAGALKMPDRIVVALGSGGTASGLLAGVIAKGLPTRIVAVDVVGNRVARGLITLAAWRALRNLAVGASALQLGRQLEIVSDQLGSGYGHATPASERAAEVARELGLYLDPTYTAKAFAHVLALGKSQFRSRSSTLYWHTLSSATLAPLLEQAPNFEDLPPKVARLLTRTGQNSR
jgi:1-aminocyclopropane-1-carboxylate deaminase/D-cysteine desulfhydrase-like pyridoxal-dependent ACC family enzyme